jgi:uncharacterized protein (DUF305 family)
VTGPEPELLPEPSPEQDGRRGQDRRQLLVLGLALAFLVGAVGYLIGVRTTDGVPSNEVDVGFLEDMTSHHDQAVKLALIELSRGSDRTAREFAQEVILFQRYELGRFRNFQDERGVANPEYSPDRRTMAWMGMPTPLADMPGMASEDDIAALEAAEGIEADRLFLGLMRDHHLGGVHMAAYAAVHAADPAVREMAGIMARNQRLEVNEYDDLLRRLSPAG